jgi:hypothetical protein
MAIQNESISKLMETHRWVYWLDETKPEPGRDGSFAVSIVFENVSGHYPTGGGDRAPWYWDRETCNAKNQQRGFTEEQAFEIVSSSMFAK